MAHCLEKTYDRLCVNCRHFTVTQQPVVSIFGMFSGQTRKTPTCVRTINRVTGEPNRMFADFARSDEGPCGQTGKLFEEVVGVDVMKMLNAHAEQERV